MQLTIFMLLRSDPSFLAMPRAERDARAAEALHASGLPACARIRQFDAEAFSARCTDILMIEVDDLAAYTAAIDALRDGPVFTTPWFEVAAIVPTVEATARAA